MKLLLFSDLHCDANAARNLAEQADKADLLIGAGDFANARRGLEICLPVLLEAQKPFLLVPGNNESLEELQNACKSYSHARVLHGDGVKFQDIEFWGLDGGVPVTPFGDWSYDLSEDEARDLLKDCPSNAVLISHSPPRGTLDISSRGQSLGSVAVREIIQQKKPRLVVCGHIHACAGQQARIGETVVINAGPNGVLWDLSI
jgi:Icc-related predicted phosphoesterase